MINVDMWNNNDIKTADSIIWMFYPLDREYRGNIKRQGEYIGDYVADTFSDITNCFSFLFSEDD